MKRAGITQVPPRCWIWRIFCEVAGMDREWKAAGALLPEKPSEALYEEVMSEIWDEDALGESMILYNRESVELIDPIEQTMTAEDWERREKSRRRRWGARCTCTCCGEEFVAGWSKGGIVLRQGEDGQLYDGWVDIEEEDAVCAGDGETITCPNCWMGAVVTPRKELARGRTCRMMQAEVVNAGAYTAVMYWMIERYQHADGTDEVEFIPHQAIVIDKGGRLRRFGAEFGMAPHPSPAGTPSPQGEGLTPASEIWRARSRVLDPFQQPYYSYEASCGKQIGGWVWTMGADTAGHTGEKTAIEEYIGAGGSWPAVYLQLWQARPQVENLMRQGFDRAVKQEIDKKLNQAGYMAELHRAPNIPWVDWSQVKPHKMLGMSREAFRAIRDKKWGSEEARGWALWQAVMPGSDALDYEWCRERVGTQGVCSLLGMVQAGWNDFEPFRAVRYLEKKDILRSGVQYLIDYRRMMRDAGMDETAETLWPRDLIAAHDRVAEQLAAERDMICTGEFAVAAVKLHGLEWTDGHLCIVIPKSEQELKDEGRILRHCVGSYGKSHCAGKPIFFVRHWRRPERSYYTLNIDMTGEEPKRVQLHGYGNEHHGEHKQYTHSIPREVQDFCDRWEREVLAPWWKEQHKPPVDNRGRKKQKEVHAA